VGGGTKEVVSNTFVSCLMPIIYRFVGCTEGEAGYNHQRLSI